MSSDPFDWLGELIEDWGIRNSRGIGTVGSYRLAQEIIEWLNDDPQMCRALGLVAAGSEPNRKGADDE